MNLLYGQLPLERDENHNPNPKKEALTNESRRTRWRFSKSRLPGWMLLMLLMLERLGLCQVFQDCPLFRGPEPLVE